MKKQKAAPKAESKPDSMKDRVLVTGATGFLGGHVLAALAREGRPAAALVRDPKSFAPGAGTAVVHGSPLSPPLTSAEGMRDVGCIVHTAAVVKHSREVPADLYELNVGGTLNMVRLAAEIGARLVFVSTSGTVGCFRDGRINADEDAPFATDVAGSWPYYDSKIRAEREARALADQLHVELIIVRPPVLLGPGDERFRSTKHVLSMMKKHVPLVPTGGMNFTDVRDAADALVRIVLHSAPKGIYHLPGTTTTLAEFFQMVHEVSGAPVPPRTLPSWALRGATKTATSLVRGLRMRVPGWIPDPVVAEMAGCHWGLTSLWSHSDLGYAPRAPRQTLVDTVDWIRRHHPEFKPQAKQQDSH